MGREKETRSQRVNGSRRRSWASTAREIIHVARRRCGEDGGRRALPPRRSRARSEPGLPDHPREPEAASASSDPRPGHAMRRATAGIGSRCRAGRACILAAVASSKRPHGAPWGLRDHRSPGPSHAGGDGTRGSSIETERRPHGGSRFSSFGRGSTPAQSFANNQGRAGRQARAQGSGRDRRGRPAWKARESAQHESRATARAAETPPDAAAGPLTRRAGGQGAVAGGLRASAAVDRRPRRSRSGGVLHPAARRPAAGAPGRAGLPVFRNI
jgi:hypothetical protein